MKVLLEPFTANGWLSATDSRLRVIAAFILILSLSLIQSLAALLVAVSTVVALSLAAGYSLPQLAKRIAILELFVLFLTLSLPFTTNGDTLFSIAGLNASYEGIQLMLEVMLRVGSSVIVTLVLLTSLTTHQLVQALSSLGLPSKLCWLLLMTIRYVHLLADEYQRLRESMKVRAFKASANRHTWKTYGWLIGMLLVRSMKKSEVLLQSMRCRGFKDEFVSLHVHSWKRSDSLYLSAVMVVAAVWVSIGFI